MYKCELYQIVPELKECAKNGISKPGERSVRVTIDRRAVEYAARAKAHKMRVGRRLRTSDDPGGTGYEIAKEVIACPTCAADYAALKEADETPAAV